MHAHKHCLSEDTSNIYMLDRHTECEHTHHSSRWFKVRKVIWVTYPLHFNCWAGRTCGFLSGASGAMRRVTGGVLALLAGASGAMRRATGGVLALLAGATGADLALFLRPLDGDRLSSTSWTVDLYKHSLEVSVSKPSTQVEAKRMWCGTGCSLGLVWSVGLQLDLAVFLYDIYECI